MLDNQKFILSSIRDILTEVISITKLNCNGIESYPLQEYILQSTFLKMTGYSEQKLKCICWDLASVDFELRYKIYQNWSFGECSTIEDKNKIFNIIIKKIQEYEESFFSKDVRLCISDSKLFNKDMTNGLSFIYEKLYRHRNRCAHNLLSYQQNLPKLNILLKKNDRDNYFYYFTVLIVLDEIFVILYKKLTDLLINSNW